MKNTRHSHGAQGIRGRQHQHSRGRPPGHRLDRNRLRSLRTERGLTQVDLADRAGLTRRTVASAESGRPVSLQTAHSIANAVGVEIGELLQVFETPALA